MISNFSIGQYYPIKSPLHRLDPRTKISAVFFFIIALFFAHDYYSYFVAILFSLLLIFLSRVPIKILLRGLKPIFIFVIITAFIHLFFTPGTEIWRWKILKLTKEGLDQAIFMSIRLILLIGVSSLLTLTTTPVSLTDGMERLLGPFKKIGLPAHELAMMMTIALRFIPTLLEETEKIMKAQVSRGANFSSGSLLKRAKVLVPLLVPLFISAFKRAEELALAMEARGYHGGEGRTRMRVLVMKWFDWISLGVIMLFLAYMGYYRWLA
ncbi:energy-coupling factor transporter transmembrane component T family protein [Candidatus Formimonas warabiya]|uniref:Energy-coupling factor transporter transmembrane protein EcfT n=1 Tax=Formimonas warabiya TaxID=1761012 RepID=A0A3G1KX89_FORW1|nr:energy-coupling factor transporter transmembrane component T [Candidatus Formimonas warabiya]ATW27143.1 transporter [Candidatus Formimonas warabiya]